MQRIGHVSSHAGQESKCLGRNHCAQISVQELWCNIFVTGQVKYQHFEFMTGGDFKHVFKTNRKTHTFGQPLWTFCGRSVDVLWTFCGRLCRKCCAGITVQRIGHVSSHAGQESLCLGKNYCAQISVQEL